MRIVELIPKIGIPHVPFGATRQHVRKVLSEQYSAGTPEPRGTKTDCYFENALQFSVQLARIIEEEDWGGEKPIMYNDQEEIDSALGVGRQEYGLLSIWWD
jgi:hypothetical protein